MTTSDDVICIVDVDTDRLSEDVEGSLIRTLRGWVCLQVYVHVAAMPLETRRKAIGAI